MGSQLKGSEPVYVGIDGGGSKCRASIYHADMTQLGTGVAGRANPLHGLQQTLESIEESVALALKDAGMAAGKMGQLVAGAGLAGVNLAHLYQQVADWQHPFQALYLTTDLHTACLGAHKGEDGAVIITGTGSCGYAHVGGQRLSLGGHGFALGDKGSGAWLGLKAAEQVLLFLDGFGADTALVKALKHELQVTDAMGIVAKLAGKSSAVYATLARAVLQCATDGDPVAIAIVREGAGYICDMADELMQLSPPRISMIGGLAEPLLPWLREDIRKQLSAALAPPEVGAFLYGKAKHDESSL